MARITWLAVATLLSMAIVSRSAVCQQSYQPYDGIQAGFDAFQLGEEKRQVNVGQQLYLNDLSRARLTPLATYGYGYRPYLSTYGVAPASLDYAYGNGNSLQIYGAGRFSGSRPLTVFEPWPYVPGDLWGDLYLPPLRQPVAQVQTQTGPHRWESHPVYNPPLALRPVLPAVNSPALRNTSYASERASSPIPATTIPGRPTESKAPLPIPPSPGPSIDDKPTHPHRRDF